MVYFRNALMLVTLASTLKAAADPIVYLIRHGEKKGDGLSADGKERAQCLVNVFNTTSIYDIGYIIAEQPESEDGKEQRPFDTVEPLAESLDLTVDTSCTKTDASCVADLVSAYTGSQNILICWEHGELTDIVEALGDSDAPTYPDGSYNIIWTDPSPYTDITDMTSEDCPGLDD